MSQITTYLQPSGPGSGTVTSVSGANGINITGTPTINPTVNLDIPVTVAHGGTGAITFTAYSVICAGTTSTGAFQNVSGLGTSGYVLTSQGAGALPQWIVNAGSTAAVTFHTNSGDATTSANAITIAGTHGINTSGASATVTAAINNAITLGDLSSITGSPAITLTTGDITLTAGNVNLPDTTSSQRGSVTIGGSKFMHRFGVANTYVGSDAGNYTMAVGAEYNTGVGQGVFQALTSGNNNAGLGTGVMDHITTSSKNSGFGSLALNQLEESGGGPFVSNTGIGYKSGFNLISGNRNSLFGDTSGVQLVTGSDNIMIGYLSGAMLPATSSNNIIIGTQGSVSDDHTLRIGDQGSGTAQINNCFIAGIVGITTSNSQAVTINSATGQLGVADIGTVSYTGVNFASSPYTVLLTDYYISVDVTGGAITVRLPNAPTAGKTFVIKDKVGLAASSNITVTTVGGVVTIDGSTSLVMNTAYESISIIFNGSSYEVF